MAGTMTDVSFDVGVANRFISSLSKSLQALCHGCMDFDSGIEIVGYININIDSGSKIDYVLNEKVLKSQDNSMTFVSNSFMAKKDKPKQLRDGVCSPVPELMQQAQYSSNYGSPRNLHERHYSPKMSYQSHQYSHFRGARKRMLPGGQRDWRTQSRKYLKTSNTEQMYHPDPSAQSSSQHFLPPQSSHFPSSVTQQSTESSIIQSTANIKTEMDDHSHCITNPEEAAGQTSEQVLFKQDPDAAVPSAEESQSGCSKSEQITASQDCYPHPQTSTQENSTMPLSQKDSEINNFSQDVPENSSNAEQSFETREESMPGTSSYNNAESDTFYSQTANNDNLDSSKQSVDFECIEIDDDEEEDFQAMFGDTRE